MQVRLREQKNRSSDVYGLDWGTLIWEGDLRTFVGDHYDAFEFDERYAEIVREIMMRGEYIGGGGQPYFQLMNAPDPDEDAGTRRRRDPPEGVGPSPAVGAR